jgi:hypothetical protein
MTGSPRDELSVVPLVAFPHHAQIGSTYLMTVDLRPTGPPDAWPYHDEEECVVYCYVDTSPLFHSEPLGEPAVVVHRYGGTYGPARFLLTAAESVQTGTLRITFVNGWGMPLTSFETPLIELGDAATGRGISVVRTQRPPSPTSVSTKPSPSMDWANTPGANDGELVGGAARKNERFQAVWPAVVDIILRGRGVPLIGPGLLEPFTDSVENIARRWSDRYRFPFTERSDFAKVAQFASVTQHDPDYPEWELKRELRALVSRFGTVHRDASLHVGLDELLWQAALADGRAFEPYRTLAGLTAPIYLTTNGDTLLEQALRAAGKYPVTDVCRWATDVEWPPSALDDGYMPSVHQPLVFHLFGLLGTPGSLVLTEDDHVRFAAAVAQERTTIYPPAVDRVLANGSYIVAGIATQGAPFQTLLATTLRPVSGARQPHVIQLMDREADAGGNTERPRSYVEEQLRDHGMTVYWGSVAEFFDEFRSWWKKAATSSPA